MKTIRQVVIPVSYKEGLLDYELPDHIKANIGSIIEVEFGKKTFIGFICSDFTSTIDIAKLKPILKKLDLNISPNLINFIKKAAHYNLAGLGDIFKMVLPGFSEKLIQEIHKITLGNLEYKFNYPTLVESQQEVYNYLKTEVIEKSETCLIEGVTGSGKTEVYLSLIMDVIKQGDNQALVLFPEICLTTQMIERFKNRLGFEPIIWHSSLTQKQRREALAKIINGAAKVVIGARSALFLPYKNLQLIVVDEEHEQSYKQEDNVCYHARDMAVLRGAIEKIPVLLCSATPSLESLVNVKYDKYKYVKLNNRYGSATLPKVNIVDMRQNKREGFISQELLTELKKVLEQNKQAMFFLNRRGFAPLMLCRHCGYRITCPDCSTWLVTHHKSRVMKCHYCDYTIPLPKECPECSQTESLVACGPGVERIAHEIQEAIPNINVLVMSRDNIEDIESYSEMITQVANNEVDVIIGTQMIAKGLHFPNVELVGIIDADMSLYGGDLRASERTFQLLNQVAGRAGRESNIGKVFLQTFNPDNPLIKAIANYDKDSFSEQEVQERKMSFMPPFSRLIAIVLSDLNEERLKKIVREFYTHAPLNNEVLILGPVEAPIYKIRNRFRYRFLLRSTKKFNLQEYVKKWFEIYKLPPQVRIKIDVDPYNFN
ncbi:MAG: primosomal protein N' [Sphingobacteriia bacterium]|nr:primosomal protein N' [Sphingobacteriia bacterium]